MEMDRSNSKEVPVNERYLMTIRQASEYFNLGEKGLRKLIYENYDADFLLRYGNRFLIKRKSFERFIDESSVL